MPKRIQILQPSVIGKIAAGEVVERPASVVKELVENALDADCNRVLVEISGGGEELMRVSDNGHGMAREDALLALERHATSKIVSAEDLQNIRSLGFRGEALASIAAVSKLELSTRDGESPVGTCIQTVGGEQREVTEVGRPVGTTVAVKRLFFNTPARRKFLRSPQTEFRRIVDVITNLALAHADVSFRLVHNGRQTLNLPPAENFRDRLTALWPAELAADLIFFDQDGAGIRIEGCVGTPKTSRTSRHQQIFLVNGRPVVDATLSHGLFQAYQSYFPKDRHAAAVIIITTDSSLVDVNVHPTKKEVRFREGRVVHDLVAFTVGKALSGLTPQLEVKDQFSWRGPDQKFVGINDGKLGYSADASQARPIQKELFPGKVGEDIQGPHEGETHAEPSFFWQLHQLYIFAAIKSGLVIIDQHAAHERVLYEQAKKSFRETAPACQQLLFPQVVELSQSELQVFDEHQDLLSKLGFAVRPFGGRTVLVEAEPAALGAGQHGQVLRDILDDVANHQPPELDREERLARAFACKRAVKAGEVLNQEQMHSLVNMLFATSAPYTCPHGRPTVIRMSMDELARKFGR